jgi:hypothetical protein
MLSRASGPSHMAIKTASLFLAATFLEHLTFASSPSNINPTNWCNASASSTVCAWWRCPSDNRCERPTSDMGQTQKSGRSPGRSVLPSEADIHQSYQSLRSRGIAFASSNSFPPGVAHRDRSPQFLQIGFEKGVGDD